MSELLCADDVLGLLDMIVPRIDAGGANPINETLHHCEYTLYRERERIHAEFRNVLNERSYVTWQRPGARNTPACS